MFTFPDSLWMQTEFTEIWERPSLRSRKELGYRNARAKWPKTLVGFRFTITTMDETDKSTLRQFLENVSFGGDEFEFIHPHTGDYHTVTLMDDRVELKYRKHGVFFVSFEVAETKPLPVSGPVS